MLHTDPVLVPFFFYLSCLCQLNLASLYSLLLSIIIVTPNPNCSSIVPSRALEVVSAPGSLAIQMQDKPQQTALGRWT